MSLIYPYNLQTKLSLIVAYIKFFGYINLAVTLGGYAVYMAALAFQNIWLSKWSNDPPSTNENRILLCCPLIECSMHARSDDDMAAGMLVSRECRSRHKLLWVCLSASQDCQEVNKPRLELAQPALSTDL